MRKTVPFKETCKSKIADLLLLENKIKLWLKDVDLDPMEAHRIFLCAHEYLSNVIEHGYHFKEQGMIEVEIFIEGESLKMQIRDESPFFDLRSYGGVASSGRGLGLLLIKKYCSNIIQQMGERSHTAELLFKLERSKVQSPLG